MERNFFDRSTGFSGYEGFHPAESSDESRNNFNAMFSGVSLLSLLSANIDVNSMPLLEDFGVPITPSESFCFNGNVDANSVPLLEDYAVPFCSSANIPASFCFSGNIDVNSIPQLEDYSFPVSSSGFGYVDDRIPVFFPKPEPLFPEETPSDSSNPSQPFNFLRADSSMFRQLPDLLSLERLSDSPTQAAMPAPPPPSSSAQKRARLDYPQSPQVFNSIDQNWFPAVPRFLPSPKPSMEASSPSTTSNPSRMRIPGSSQLARQRRQKLSEKTRCLQKLLPWDKKMDMATMLEHSYKYVKFLQAQLEALKAMPVESAIIPRKANASCGEDLDLIFAGLSRLTRNQLLQVLVNSPVAQTILCSQGSCVVAVEQLGLLKKVTEMRRRALNNVGFDPSSFA
ncbi:hypothetical protein UlMin_044230 [Ulmus minor]